MTTLSCKSGLDTGLPGGWPWPVFCSEENLKIALSRVFPEASQPCWHPARAHSRGHKNVTFVLHKWARYTND
ncbi:hypothetical protein L585_08185 [Pantoea ananatis BRT175]|nr:hypothetical protein L585_08185 [Pantoea ananatis BRT175]PQK85208.1 hypothetical protein CG432_18125 [Pantoea ananatis]RQN05831.1 hypothetical protein EHQ51_13670 [Pantoea ananatis]